MNLRINILFFFLILFSCKKAQTKDPSSTKYNYIIKAEELKSIIDNKNIKILDFRKKEFYNKEHIVGALQIWRTDIEDSSYPYKGMMPSKKQIEILFGSLGISNNDTVIVYDNKGLCEATRLWWILQNYNFKNIKILEGGIETWKSLNGIVNSKKPEVKIQKFKLSVTANKNYYASKKDVINSLNKNVVFLDTRTSDEFSGIKQKKGATKAGRIPNSIHIDWTEAIKYSGNQHLKSIEDLEKIYTQKLNLKKTDSIIIYCHTGVRSAHTTFVLTQLLGYKNVRNYDGSWTEWSFNKDLPYVNDNKINKK